MSTCSSRLLSSRVRSLASSLSHRPFCPCTHFRELPNQQASLLQPLEATHPSQPELLQRSQQHVPPCHRLDQCFGWSLADLLRARSKQSPPPRSPGNAVGWPAACEALVLPRQLDPRPNLLLGHTSPAPRHGPAAHSPCPPTVLLPSGLPPDPPPPLPPLPPPPPPPPPPSPPPPPP